MSDNIPFEIQEEILKSLPVKSLIQFRSVSKSWKSLIDSSDFVAHYTSRQQHLLFRYFKSDKKYVSVVDDNTFPHQKVSLTLPPLVKLLKDCYRTIGTSHGLFCLYTGYLQNRVVLDKGFAVIWNPCIRKAVGVVVPNMAEDNMFKTALGFGVCHSDPKIVKIRYVDRLTNMESVTSIPWQVEVFTLSTGSWRSPYGNLPRKSIYFGYGQNVDGVYYWLAADRSTIDFNFNACNMIVSFDMTSEEFREINLPDSFAYNRSGEDYFYLCNLRESLVVVERKQGRALLVEGLPYARYVFSVWMMENGVPRTFTKLYTISTPDATILDLCVFRKSGEPVIRVKKDYREAPSLVVYEPNLKHISNLGTVLGTNKYLFSAHSYMETLLLLDQSSFVVSGNGKRLYGISMGS